MSASTAALRLTQLTAAEIEERLQFEDPDDQSDVEDVSYQEIFMHEDDEHGSPDSDHDETTTFILDDEDDLLVMPQGGRRTRAADMAALATVQQSVDISTPGPSSRHIAPTVLFGSVDAPRLQRALERVHEEVPLHSGPSAVSSSRQLETGRACRRLPVGGQPNQYTTPIHEESVYVAPPVLDIQVPASELQDSTQPASVHIPGRSRGRGRTASTPNVNGSRLPGRAARVPGVEEEMGVDEPASVQPVEHGQPTEVPTVAAVSRPRGRPPRARGRGRPPTGGGRASAAVPHAQTPVDQRHLGRGRPAPAETFQRAPVPCGLVRTLYFLRSK